MMEVCLLTTDLHAGTSLIRPRLLKIQPGRSTTRGRTRPALWWFLVLLLAVFLSASARSSSGGPIGIEPRDRDELIDYARHTWKSIAAMARDTALPADSLTREADGKWKTSYQTTPTDIASYLWSVLAAARLEIITDDEATRRLDQILQSMMRLERAHGFVQQNLDARTCAALKTSLYDGTAIRPIASSVDNGWLAAGLLMVRNTCPSLRERAEALLRPMDFGFFYVPYDASDPIGHPGQIHGPFHVDRQTFGGFHRLLNTEQRIFSYIGIARGQIPAEHYYCVRRTLKQGEQEQRQVAEGVNRSYLNVPVFEGHYEYRRMRIVPSWGGSMFEALMVTLFVPEEEWAPRSWGVNHGLYVRAQIEYGLKEAGYGCWGFSPACDPEGGYRTYGVGGLASDPTGYSSNDTIVRSRRPVPPTTKRRFDNGIITPHASFLALRFAPREALANLRNLKEKFHVYGDYGFMDAINVSTGDVANVVLMLDQGMIMAAIANALAGDAMRRAFVDRNMQRVLEPLISMEEFTAGPPARQN
jgi:Putative glucoamylase/Protein of unknown function (DUF3131)